MDTFPTIDNPDYGLSSSPEANVEETALGDGYVFREAVGINYLRDSWSPTWSSLDPAVAQSTYLWLRARLKLTPFLWFHPVEHVQYQVVCSSVTKTDDTWGNATLSATFVQDFNPQ